MNRLNQNLPDSPGVYFFKKGKDVLYIGKATSLRDRVRSYFGSDVIKTRGQAIVNMIDTATSLSYEKTDSVLEALILESTLIKQYQPKYNTREKDDRSYFYVIITREEYPKVLAIRGKDLVDKDEDYIKDTFGPFPHGTELKEALNVVRKIFPFRDKCQPNSGKLCFQAQIGLCPGICDNVVSQKEYLKNIRNIILFFNGKKARILKNFNSEMNTLASELKFEEAIILKKRIFALKHIEDIALIKNRKENFENVEKVFRIEAYDISHLAHTDRVGVMTVIENGEIKKSDYRKFKIKKTVDKIGDTADLKQVLDRRFYHEEWRLPDIIVVDGASAQKNVAEKVVNLLKLKIFVIAVKKDEFHRPIKILGDSELINKYEKEILLANSESHRFAVAYQRSLRKF